MGSDIGCSHTLGSMLNFAAKNWQWEQSHLHMPSAKGLFGSLWTKCRKRFWVQVSYSCVCRAWSTVITSKDPESQDAQLQSSRASRIKTGLCIDTQLRSSLSDSKRDEKSRKKNGLKIISKFLLNRKKWYYQEAW